MTCVHKRRTWGVVSREDPCTHTASARQCQSLIQVIIILFISNFCQSSLLPFFTSSFTYLPGSQKMSSALDDVKDILLSADIPRKIEYVLDARTASYSLDSEARKALETSRRRMITLKLIWLRGAKDMVVKSEKLWIGDSWKVIKNQLDEIVRRIDQLLPFKRRNTDSSLSKRSPWAKFRWTQSRKPRRTSLSDFALELSFLIERLCKYSDEIFTAIHVGPRKQSPGSSHTESLEHSIIARPGAFLVYQGLQACKSRFDLNIDLKDNGASSVTLDYWNPKECPKISSYQLMHRSGNLEDLLVQSCEFTRLSAPVDSKILRDPAEMFENRAPSRTELKCIQPDTYETACFFYVADSPIKTSRGRSLAALLAMPRSADDNSHGPIFSTLERLDLAFQLSKCVEYLLGTPWLASLGSERIFECGSGKSSSFAISVPTLSLGDLYLEDPEALSEPSQLFRFGVLLIEIAIGKSDRWSVSEGIEDRYRWASNLVPFVKQAFGLGYSEACAFCIEDRRSIFTFRQASKCECPGQNGWNTYLRNFLSGYYSQVIDRSVTLS